MGSLKAMNGSSEDLSSHPNVNKRWDNRNHSHAVLDDLKRSAHGCAYEGISDADGQTNLSKQVIETLQNYIYSLEKESPHVSTKVTRVTSQTESAAKSRIHELCSEIHSLVSGSYKYEVFLQARVLLIKTFRVVDY